MIYVQVSIISIYTDYANRTANRYWIFLSKIQLTNQFFKPYEK